MKSVLVQHRRGLLDENDNEMNLIVHPETTVFIFSGRLQ